MLQIFIFAGIFLTYRMDLKKQAALRAVEFIRDQSMVGLGAGATIAIMAERLLACKEAGMQLRVLSSSGHTKKLLQQFGFEVLDIAAVDHLDQYFDGCDQVTADLHALKSGGGIHTQEKLLAAMADEFIIVGDEGKLVQDRFDARFPLVLELIPESLLYVQSALGSLFNNPKMALRFDVAREGPAKTTNGNHLLDIWFESWPELEPINRVVKAITGVLETSLFYGMAQRAVIGSSRGVLLYEKNGPISEAPGYSAK